MISPGELQHVVESYVASLSEGNLDGICSLFAEDATVEDPVGTPAYKSNRQFANSTLEPSKQSQRFDLPDQFE